MANRQIQNPDVLSRPSETSSETAVPPTNDEKTHVAEQDRQEGADDYENINYPKPWKFEKWFVGGYSRERMLKFKNPKRMYTAINLFAGTLRETPIVDVSRWVDGTLYTRANPS